MTPSNMDKPLLTQKDIEAGLRELGLRRGDAVEVHSSLSSFGWVEGGATTVIEALMSVVGKEGALVMSAYPVSPPIPLTEEEEARGITWKVRLLDLNSDEKTGLGAVADAFRKRPDVITLKRKPCWKPLMCLVPDFDLNDLARPLNMINPESQKMGMPVRKPVSPIASALRLVPVLDRI